MRSNTANFALEINGEDLAEAIAPHLRPGVDLEHEAASYPSPRLVSLSLSEKLENGADELELTLSNHPDRDGGTLAPIKRGVKFALALGWAAGPDVAIGLVEKGSFIVDEVVKEGGGSSPDTVRIRARSADFTGKYRNRKNQGWKGKTIREVVGQIAGDNGYEPQIHDDLGDLTVDSAEQAAKSDMAFVRDLGRRHDAIATVKDGKLLFLPIGSETTASGKTVPSHTLTRRDNSRWTFTIADREEHDGAEAKWHDRKAAKGKTVKEGGGKNPKRIKRSFATEAEAKQAAKAEAKRAARGTYQFTFEMALGDPAIAANDRVDLQGWDEEIDAIKWLVEEVSHTLDGQGGLTSSLSMKSLN